MAEAREGALQALYQAEQSGEPPDTADLGPRARRLVEGVWSHREEFDRALAEVSRGWRVERMAAVDRNLLRIGLYELRYEPGTPVGVIISEAVRLAKQFSTERSGAFVNGVLGHLAEEERASAR